MVSQDRFDCMCKMFGRLGNLKETPCTIKTANNKADLRLCCSHMTKTGFVLTQLIWNSGLNSKSNFDIQVIS